MPRGLQQRPSSACCVFQEEAAARAVPGRFRALAAPGGRHSPITSTAAASLGQDAGCSRDSSLSSSGPQNKAGGSPGGVPGTLCPGLVIGTGQAGPSPWPEPQLSVRRLLELPHHPSGTDASALGFPSLLHILISCSAFCCVKVTIRPNLPRNVLHMQPRDDLATDSDTPGSDTESAAEERARRADLSRPL